MVLTIGPVPEKFSLPAEARELAAREQLEIDDRVMFGERYFRLSSRAEGVDLDAHVDRTFRLMLHAAHLIRTRSTTLPVQFGCAVYGKRQVGLHLSGARLADLAALEIALDLQVYDFTDLDLGPNA
ncbi:MAG: hypothetical protein R3F20_09155 [Planctomycetota bacterium]